MIVILPALFALPLAWFNPALALVVLYGGWSIGVGIRYRKTN